MATRPSPRLCVRAVAALLVGLLTLGPVATASAQYGDDEQSKLRKADGRLRGYENNNVILDTTGVVLTYVAFIGLSLVATGVMFKSARRTHLD
jgi:hypothetical protein